MMNLSIKIVSLALTLESGGPTNTISAFKKALGGDLYSFCRASDQLAVPDARPVRLGSALLYGLSGISIPASIKKLRAQLAQASLISCHSFYRDHSMFVNRLSRQTAVPYWFVPHGILDPWVMEKGTLAKKLFLAAGGRSFIEGSSTVIFSTTAEKRKAMSLFPLPESEVIPWPVELVDDSNRELRRDIIRNRLRIPKAARILLYFGRLHSMKRPLETIVAVAAAKCENVHLIIVGNEQDVSLRECHRLAKNEGIAARVHVIGPVYGQEKFDYLIAADGYISLSNRENFNHTAAESMSAKLPLILSPGNDLHYDIASEQCSWLLEDDKVATATKAIEAFAEISQKELLNMGDRGRSWVENNLQFSTFQERINELAAKYAKNIV